MKTYFAEIIPKIKKFSQKLDDLSFLTNQHWVIIDESKNHKTVYIFRDNNELIISVNGKIEKGKWEYLGNDSLMIEREKESYLFKHGFFDGNILALKIDGKYEYAFLVNESRFVTEINSLTDVINFLRIKYTETDNIGEIKKYLGVHSSDIQFNAHNTILNRYSYSKGYNKGFLEIETLPGKRPYYRDKVFINSQAAPDGKYKIGTMWNIHVRDGVVFNITLF